MCAAILASWGRRVVLIEERRSPRRVPAETLVPAALPRFARLGLDQILLREAFRGTSRQGAIWGEAEPRWRELSEGQHGFRIDRDVFDLALRDHAAQCGTEVLEGWRVLDPLEDEAPWQLRSASGESREVHATCRVVAAGRPLDDARSHSELEQAPFQTCALWSVGTGDPETTFVEAVAHGWLWTVPLSDGSVCGTLFADLDQVKATGRDSLFAASVAGALGPAREFQTSEIRGTLCTPTLRSTRRRVFLAGDAACNIDPLSSQGVEKALASAEETAFAVNTQLDHPEYGDELREHRTRWERRLFRAHARDTRNYYRQEQRFEDAVFWRRRQASSEPTSGTPDLSTAWLVRSPQLKRSTDWQRAGNLLEPVEAWSHPKHGEPLRRIGAFEVDRLLELLPGSLDFILAKARREPRWLSETPRTLVAALHELVACEFIQATNEKTTDAAGSR